MIENVAEVLEGLLSNVSLDFDTDINELTDLITKLETVREGIKLVESQLLNLKESERQLVFELIPSKFAELGLSEITMLNGQKVTVKPFVQARLTQDTKRSAIEWLEEHGYGDLIKVTVENKFGMNEYDTARELAHKLSLAGYNTAFDATVHPQTLGKFVRERLEANEAFPMDLFNVYLGQQCVIK